ncbi:HRDC domain-containing protein [Deinococcus sp.]|uniref:HRDC domain-containing protein n=1 Tax=Deinococcus sp. TaxID=47478 RepID=UPI0025D81D91|nr:HRDC domain-containing protein [Deinococcus sp.]
MTAAPPDVRLPGLHAEAGDPQTRLSTALSNLEGTDWGLFLSGEAALAQQLAALLGPGTLRVDARLPLSRELFAAAGLALATTDADWRGARGVWLLEPDERAIKRARRAGVSILVDGTLAPGGGWTGREANLVVYRDGATLTGFGDVSLSAVFGMGELPERVGAAPSDLSMAMALRDLATMPLRLARAARTTSILAERLGGAAQAAGPTALLLGPDSAFDTPQPTGGVLAAARNVNAGTLITPGVQGVDAVLALLQGDYMNAEPPAVQNVERGPQGSRSEGRGEFRNEGRRGDGRGDGRSDNRPPRQERERGQQRDGQQRDGQQQNAAPPAQPAPAPAELPYIPEIVFSDSRPHPEPQRLEPQRQESQPEEVQQPQGEVWPHEQQGEEPEQVASEPQAEQTAPQEQPRPSGRREREERPRRERPRRDAPQAAPAPDPHPELVLTPDLPAAAGVDPLEGLDDAQRNTYNRLRDWRNTEAKRQEISRFIIASNATLAEIARFSPADETELRKVKGMGPERTRKYGDALLEAVRG